MSVLKEMALRSTSRFGKPAELKKLLRHLDTMALAPLGGGPRAGPGRRSRTPTPAGSGRPFPSQLHALPEGSGLGQSPIHQANFIFGLRHRSAKHLNASSSFLLPRRAPPPRLIPALQVSPSTGPSPAALPPPPSGPTLGRASLWLPDSQRGPSSLSSPPSLLPLFSCH